MKIKFLKIMTLSGCATIFAVGCAASTHRGVVAMKIDEGTAHVCIDPDEVKVGDQLTVFRNECSKPIAASKAQGIAHCKKNRVGTATVTSFLNEHYAEVKFADGTDFREGDMVEKTK